MTHRIDRETYNDLRRTWTACARQLETALADRDAARRDAQQIRAELEALRDGLGDLLRRHAAS